MFFILHFKILKNFQDFRESTNCRKKIKIFFHSLIIFANIEIFDFLGMIIGIYLNFI